MLDRISYFLVTMETKKLYMILRGSVEKCTDILKIIYKIGWKGKSLNELTC